MSFALHSLGWWVPFSRVKTVPKTEQVSGNHDYLSTLEQVTAPLWTSVSSRRMGIETALKGPSFHALIFQDYSELQAEFPGPLGLFFPASKGISGSDFPMGLSWGMLTCPLE